VTKRHMFFMLLCCLIPVIGLGAVLIFNIPVSSAVWVGLVLLCPLSHLIMMKFMVHDEDSSHHYTPVRSEQSEVPGFKE
jgi:putative Mn2+ efflux pump MntP